MSHGTLTGYKTWRCRCEPCRAANREHRAKERRAGAKERDIIMHRVPPEEFGAWRDSAACAGRDDIDWFPTAPTKNGANGRGGRVSTDPAYRLAVARAKAVCASCPVIGECLSAALSVTQHYDHGIRGGMTASERINLRRSKP